VGAFSGLAGTVFMTLFEIPFWKKWGTSELVEWQLNWAIVSRLSGRPSWKSQPPNAIWSIVGHLFHGTVSGIVFSLLFPAASIATRNEYSDSPLRPSLRHHIMDNLFIRTTKEVSDSVRFPKLNARTCNRSLISHSLRNGFRFTSYSTVSLRARAISATHWRSRVFPVVSVSMWLGRGRM
jgi:hypothetical protein